jgi:hypothetical protein
MKPVSEEVKAWLYKALSFLASELHPHFVEVQEP